MANEIRLRRNNISGTITDNPLAIGATTINSAGFVDLPVVDATNHVILILDPQEVGGTAEIVRVTAHTAAATSVTVVRGQEGTTARSHVFNTTWMHGPVASDTSLSDVTSGTRPSVPYTGELIYETDTNSQKVFSNAAWFEAWRRQFAFRAISASNQAIGSGTAANITFGTEVFDFGGNFAASTYTVPVDGLYWFYAEVNYNPTATVDDRGLLQIQVNAVEIARGDIQNRGTVNGDLHTLNCGGLYVCTAGQSVIVNFNAVTGAVNLISGLAKFMGYRIGAAE